LLLVLSALLAFAALTMDATVLTAALIEEGPPHFDGLYPLWFVLLAAGSLSFVVAIATWPAPPKGATRSAAHPERTWPAWGMLLLSIAGVLMFLASPQRFYFLAMEDHVVEALSAVAAFAAGAVFLRAAWVLGRHRRGNRLLATAALAAAVVLILLGLEEISWFQRILVVPTPDWMQANQQAETNLHNFATDVMENVYYTGAFVLLVAAPFVQDRTGLFSAWTPAAFFVPSRNVLFAAAIAFAWNYDMWNTVFTQVGFWTTLFVLAWYAWSARDKALPWALLVSFGVTQALFIACGSDFVRLWDVSEYKELFIPLALLEYALETLAGANALASN
jgi:hypothetical protein